MEILTVDHIVRMQLVNIIIITLPKLIITLLTARCTGGGLGGLR